MLNVGMFKVTCISQFVIFEFQRHRVHHFEENHDMLCLVVVLTLWFLFYNYKLGVFTSQIQLKDKGPIS